MDRTRLEQELKRLRKKAARLSLARSALRPGSSRFRVTNAKWAWVAEARDRVQAQLAALAEVTP